MAMNPVIKFTTLFGLLAVELAVQLAAEQGTTLTHVLAAAFFAVSVFFVWRSFYGDADWRDERRRREALGRASRCRGPGLRGRLGPIRAAWCLNW